MALNKRNNNPFAPVDAILYMLIDTTVVEQTKVVLIGDMKHVQAHGHILMNEGKTVIGPVVAGRSFAKLSKMQLQYLYWNTCGHQPPEDYGQLVQECLAEINKIEPTKDNLASLQLIIDNKVPQHLDTKAPAPVVRPPTRTTTGIIWTICDEVLEDLNMGNPPKDAQGWKEIRTEAVNRCEAEGFNSSTISVQYSKWKASKTVTIASN